MIFEVVNQEFHGWLETVKGCLMSLCLKSYLLKKKKEVVNMI